MEKYERHNISLVTNGTKSVEVSLVTNMRIGKSHIELSVKEKLKFKTNEKEQILKIAEDLMDGAIDFKDVKDKYEY